MMSIEYILSSTLEYLRRFSKRKLRDAVLILREQHMELAGKYKEIAGKYKDLEEENNRLKAELSKKKIKEVNRAVNQPSSKQAEWELKGVGNDGLGKKKGRGKKGRQGAENVRIIEDIPPTPTALQVIEVKQEKKYCPDCKKVVTARSELALPKINLGLNTTVKIAYLWLMTCFYYFCHKVIKIQRIHRKSFV